MTFSATRISSWMNCNRRGGWRYFMDYPEPDNDDTSLGKKVHAALERVAQNPALTFDMMEETEAIAAEAWPIVQPLLTPLALFESESVIQGRHRWTSWRDLRPYPGLVVDYKTTGDFKWVKSGDDLLFDPQAALYSEAEFRAHPELDKVGLLWVYLKKRRPFSAKSSFEEVSRSHASACFEALESYADEMQAAAHAAPADPVARHKYVLSLAPNFDHCDAYRGCPHRARCPDSPLVQDPEKKKGKSTMNLMERLATQAATVNTPAFANTTGAANPLAALLRPAVAEGPGNPHPMGARSDIPSSSPNLPGVTFDASWSQAPAEATPVPTPAEIPVTPQPPPGVVPPAINPPKRGPGRPRKNPVVDPPVTPAPMLNGASTSVVVAPAPVVTVPTSVAPTEVKNDFMIASLFVGCFPRPGEYVNFDALVRDAKEMITLPVYYTNFGYKSNGMLLEAVERIITHRRPTHLVVMDPRTPEATLCLSYLRSVSATIVEGVR